MFTSVENEMSEVWERRLLGRKQYIAFGPRDLLVIKSDESLSYPASEPRRKGVVTEEDKEKLKRDDIPIDYWEDEIQIFIAKMSKEKRYNILPVEDNPEITSEQVLEKIKLLLKTTSKPGVCIAYFGPGRKNRGDWCFVDGYITFTDIILLYMKYFRNKCLSIISDCSFSGYWVQFAMNFLNKCAVTPCLHSARASGVFLSVISSCQQNEVPYTHLFVNRGFSNDKNSGYTIFQCPKHLAAHQNVRYCSNIRMICNADNIDSECLLQRDYTFEEFRQSQSLGLARCLSGKKWFVFITDTDDDELLYRMRTGRADPMRFGKLVVSGNGRRPNENVTDWIDRTYPGHSFDWSKV